MIIKNHELADFGEFLMNLKLKGRTSNMRVRLVRLLQERIALVNEERGSLFNDYVKKDENGDPIKEIDEESGNEIYPFEDVDAYKREMEKLMTEEFIIEETQERELMMSEVKNAVLNCDIEFSREEAVQYERWCEIVEDSI